MVATSASTDERAEFSVLDHAERQIRAHDGVDQHERRSVVESASAASSCATSTVSSSTFDPSCSTAASASTSRKRTACVRASTRPSRMTWPPMCCRFRWCSSKYSSLSKCRVAVQAHVPHTSKTDWARRTHLCTRECEM